MDGRPEVLVSQNGSGRAAKSPLDG